MLSSPRRSPRAGGEGLPPPERSVLSSGRDPSRCQKFFPSGPSRVGFGVPMGSARLVGSRFLSLPPTRFAQSPEGGRSRTGLPTRCPPQSPEGGRAHAGPARADRSAEAPVSGGIGGSDTPATCPNGPSCRLDGTLRAARSYLPPGCGASAVSDRAADSGPRDPNGTDRRIRGVPRGLERDRRPPALGRRRSRGCRALFC